MLWSFLHIICQQLATFLEVCGNVAGHLSKKLVQLLHYQTIVVWFLLNFGWTDAGFGMLNFDGLEGAAMEAAQAECILAKIGNLISWIFTPLGWGRLEDDCSSYYRTCSEETL